MFLRPRDITVLKFEKDLSGRVVTVDIADEGGIVRLINIYGPNAPTESEEFYKEEVPYFFIGACNFIVGGDFNCVTDVKDTSTGKHKNRGGAEQLMWLVNNFKLIDVWVTAGGGESGFTRLSKNGGSRIDRIYVSSQIAVRIKAAATIETIDISDHLGVLVDLQKMGAPGYRRPWRMNVKLLEDADVDKEIREIIQREFRDCNSTFKWWDK